MDAGDFAFSIKQIFRWCFVTSYAFRNVLIKREAKAKSIAGSKLRPIA